MCCQFLGLEKYCEGLGASEHEVSGVVDSLHVQGTELTGICHGSMVSLDDLLEENSVAIEVSKGIEVQVDKELVDGQAG